MDAFARADPLRRRPDRRGTAAADAGRAAVARARATATTPPTRPTPPRSPAHVLPRLLEVLPTEPPPGADRAEPGRSRGAARGLDDPGHLRRPAAPVRARSSPRSSTRRSPGSSSGAEVTGFVRSVHAATTAAPGAPPIAITCGTAEENLANNRLMAAELAATGVDVAWGEVRQGHTWTCWRDSLDPHLTDLLTKVWALMEREQVELAGTRLRPARDGRPLRPLRPPGAGVPERAGPGLGLREQRDGRAPSPTSSRPAGSSSTASTRTTTSPGRTARSRSRTAPSGTAPTSPGSPTRSAGFIGEDSPGVSDMIVTGCSLGAYHALNFALTRADLFPVAICQSGNYDPSQWHALGRPRGRGVLHQPDQLRAQPPRRPPATGCAAGSTSC